MSSEKLRTNRKKYVTQNAITLIALVITIIILLILAGVTLNMILRRKWVI